MNALALTTLGVGAADSPRFAPAGLLVGRAGVRVMLDGGPGAERSGPLDAWLLSDDHAELTAPIRRLARARGLEPRMGDFTSDRMRLEFHPVIHTNHLMGGYLIQAAGWKIAWAPEFLEFPTWAGGACCSPTSAGRRSKPSTSARRRRLGSSQAMARSSGCAKAAPAGARIPPHATIRNCRNPRIAQRPCRKPCKPCDFRPESQLLMELTFGWWNTIGSRQNGFGGDSTPHRSHLPRRRKSRR